MVVLNDPKMTFLILRPDSRRNTNAPLEKIGILLFRDHPYTQDFFEQLKGQSLDTLATSSKMRAHATTVMYSLTSLVDSLDDPECLVGLARKISANHLRNGVQMKEFDVLGGVLVEFLREKLGSAFTEFHKEAWITLYTTFCSVVDDEMKQLKAAKK
ncbi:hypothetical protein ScPMuIL_005544 [Solemya velum]